MNLQDRILLLAKLGDYLNQNTDEYQAVAEKAYRNNPWFIPAFIELATTNIATHFLQQKQLEDWANSYSVPDRQQAVKRVGIVMAGNIPLVGFHDLLCTFISGHTAIVKRSSKDETLITHLVEKMKEWNPAVSDAVVFADKLSGCDAYIATGSNNTGRYFEYYFGKYPHIIRCNRTSVAILDENETETELDALADDIALYFGLGCRNVTKLYVPREYDFAPLLGAIAKYQYFLDFHKYKHNYDYHLALLIMGNKFYMTDGATIFTENVSPFTPVSQVHYEYYADKNAVIKELGETNDIQAVTGHGFIPFGEAQQPGLRDYADGVDTMHFLLHL